jgi:hypothetical protein
MLLPRDGPWARVRLGEVAWLAVAEMGITKPRRRRQPLYSLFIRYVKHIFETVLKKLELVKGCRMNKILGNQVRQLQLDKRMT